MSDRAQKNFDVGYTPDDIAKGREIRAKVTNDMALKDAQAAVNEAAKAGKVGIVGYCWGGLVAWLASAKVTGSVAAAPYYRSGILRNAALPPTGPRVGHSGADTAHLPGGR